MIKLAPDWARIRQRSLFVATPCYGNQVHVGYNQSMCNLVYKCATNGVRLSVKPIGCDSLVPRARNLLAAYFRRSTSTDLLYIDADITFDPEDVLSLLALDQPIVGGVYPRKQLDWPRIAAASRSGLSPAALARHGYIPVMNWAGSGDFPLDSLIEVKHLGTGFLRIRREVFDTMIAKLGDRITYDYAAEQDGFAGTVGHDFFPCGPDVRYPLGSGGRQYLSEDWAFCELARECGFKIYAAPWVKLVHSGTWDFVGDLGVLDEARTQSTAAAKGATDGK